MARWHVEHRDGRRWTWYEIVSLRMRHDVWVEGVGLDCHCEPILLNGSGSWGYAADATDDMVVVFDD